MVHTRFIYSVLAICMALMARACVPPALGQNKNPDLSVITDLRAFAQDAQNSDEKIPVTIELDEIEMAVQGYLNPYARADIYFAKHGLENPLEIEEASVTFLRGLPLGLNIKAGKYLVDFGKLNTLHPHAYPFVNRPLLHRLYFGDDGFNDTGIQISALLPTGDIYTEWSFNFLKGQFAIGGHNHGHDAAESEEHAAETESPEWGYSSRLASHFQVSDYSNLETGINGAYGTSDPDLNLHLAMAALDLKYKWRPNKYRSLLLQAEVLFSQREFAPTDVSPVKQSIRSHGGWAFANLQFRQRWSAGLKGEYMQAPDNSDKTYKAASIFTGYALMEETTLLRLLLEYQKHPDENPIRSAMVQVLFSLGPHKPHSF